jgi:type II restriction/modification system DNA methylase subunit YeeA
MTDAAAVQVFVQHWEQVELNEKAVAQSHFNALCHLLGLKGPVEADTKGQFFRFEKPLTKSGGSAGFADVWFKDRFAWEYKTKGKYPDLRAAYQQLLLYKEDLDNPPILVACDIANYEVHIAFTGYPTRVHRFTNADLQNASTRELLRQVFTDPEQLRPVERTATITEKVAGRFAEVAQFLDRRKFAPVQIASFFMKVLFALFAEDIKLLPAELMSNSLKQSIRTPEEFPERARALFRAMREGGYFGLERVPQFDGWLFAGDEVLPLNADELHFLADAARQDWSAVEPAIFGTLFERSLDPSKRAQLGAHYTSREDILLIVEPVLMAPLRREWETVKTGAEALRAQWEVDGLSANRRRQLQGVAEGMLLDFMERLAQVRVLDAACGSGNFLYVALNELKNLEKVVWAYAGGVGLMQPELGVSPAQLFGIEKNPFAAELAQVVVWIGYLQWLKVNGFLGGKPKEPILQNLHNIECRDAILTVDLNGNPAEPPWPEADVIIGNPPFLGGKKLRTELGDEYVDAVFKLYDGRVPREADLVTYWFERARALIADDKARRAGLLATQSIRAGANRRVLAHLKQTGDIFMAWSDRPWILDGAAVRVSMVGFDDGNETTHTLNGSLVQAINADLTSALDLTKAQRLNENLNISYMGDTKGGAFDIPADLAQQMLQAPTNLNGRSNSDVVHPWVNGLDITRRPRGMWIIDFGVGMPEREATQYTLPFDYVLANVKPARLQSRTTRSEWWLHERPRPDMRLAIASLLRYIATPRVARHRIFIWVSSQTLPDSRIYLFSRDDDYFLGILHSRLHEVWSLATSSRHGVGNDPTYNNTTCFETFPFPYPPGQEDQADPKVQAVAGAARELVRLRDEWLNPPGLPASELKQYTLTNLYNRRPDWLDQAHKRLDAAVLDAYGWPHDLTDDEILERLLALNLERAAGQGAVAVQADGDDEE